MQADVGVNDTRPEPDDPTGASRGGQDAMSGANDLSPRHRIYLTILAGLLALTLSSHFLCTTVYLTPPNPIRLRFHSYIERVRLFCDDGQVREIT